MNSYNEEFEFWKWFLIKNESVLSKEDIEKVEGLIEQARQRMFEEMEGSEEGKLFLTE